MNEAVTIRMTDTHVCLRVPFDLTQVCQSLRGRWNPGWKCWLWPKDKQAARRILDAFGPRAAQADGGDSLLALAGPDEILRPQDKVGIPDVLPGLKTKPWRHQRAAFSFARSKRGAMLAMGMGTGQEPRHRGLAARQTAFADSLPESRDVRMAPRVRAARRLSLRCRRPVRQVDQGQDGGAETVNGQGDGFRPPACRCLQLRRRMARSAGRRHARRPVGCRGARREPQDQGPRRAHVPLLRGTAQGGEAGVRADRHADAAQPLDIYAQYRAIDDRVFGRNFSRFRQSYAIMGGFGGKQVVGYKDADALRAKFLSIAFQAGRDVIELPEAVHQVVPVEIGPKARRVYTGLATAFYAELDAGEVTAANALVKLLRVAAGHGRPPQAGLRRG